MLYFILLAIIITSIALAFFGDTKANEKPRKSLEQNDIPYDVICTKVYRQLNMLYSSLDSDEALNAALLRMAEIEREIPHLQCLKTRRAYRYWLPHFRQDVTRCKASNVQRKLYDDRSGEIELLPNK